MARKINPKIGGVIVAVLAVIIIAAVASTASKQAATPVYLIIEGKGSFHGAMLQGSNTKSIQGSMPYKTEMVCDNIFSANAQKESDDRSMMTIKVIKGDKLMAVENTDAAFGVVIVSGNC